MMFVGFSNLGRVRGEIFYISPRSARSRREARLFLYLSKISPRSCRDFEIHKLTKIFTQSFPDEMNNFSPLNLTALWLTISFLFFSSISNAGSPN